jgi:hypothetical protein
MVSVAILAVSVHNVPMPYRPRKNKPHPKPGDPGSVPPRDSQFQELRRHDFASRNILSRLRNRKSDIK